MLMSADVLFKYSNDVTLKMSETVRYMRKLKKLP